VSREAKNASTSAPIRQIPSTWRWLAPRRRKRGGMASVTSGARSLRLSDVWLDV